MSLRMGVVGAGNISTSRHIPAFQKHEDTEVVGIYDRNADRARKVASRTGVRKYDGFAEICADCDLLSLCTPPTAHCSQAVEALETGCHVLTEKPMAMSVSETEEMVAAADQSGRRLSVVHNFLFMDSIRTLRSRVSTGRAGSVQNGYMVKLESKEKRGKAYLSEDDPSEMRSRNWRLHRLFWDEASHLIYLLRSVLGSLTVETATLSSPRASSETLRARFGTETGADGSLFMEFDAPISEWWFIVFCTNELLLVDVYRDLVIRIGKERDHSALRVLKVIVSAAEQGLVGALISGINLLRERYVQGYAIPDAGFSHQIDDLTDSITNGTALSVDGTDGRDTIRVMEEIVNGTELRREMVT